VKETLLNETNEVETLGETPAAVRGGGEPAPAEVSVPAPAVESAADVQRAALDAESKTAPDSGFVHELKRRARANHLHNPVYAMAYLHEKVDALAVKLDQVLEVLTAPKDRRVK
jgi:hypothetical protein